MTKSNAKIVPPSTRSAPRGRLSALRGGHITEFLTSILVNTALSPCYRFVRKCARRAIGRLRAVFESHRLTRVGKKSRQPDQEYVLLRLLQILNVFVDRARSPAHLDLGINT